MPAVRARARLRVRVRVRVRVGASPRALTLSLPNPKRERSQAPADDLKIRRDPKLGTYVQGLTEVELRTPEQLAALIDEGNKRRATLYLPVSPCISPYLPISHYISLYLPGCVMAFRRTPRVRRLLSHAAARLAHH